MRRPQILATKYMSKRRAVVRQPSTPVPGFRFRQYNLPNQIAEENILRNIFGQVDKAKSQEFTEWHRQNDNRTTRLTNQASNWDRYLATHMAWGEQEDNWFLERAISLEDRIVQARTDRKVQKRRQRRQESVVNTQRTRWNQVFLPITARGAAAPVQLAYRFKVYPFERNRLAGGHH